MTILNLLRKQGQRLTPARKKIAEIFSEEKPLTAAKLLEMLSKKGVKVNKTTVYRELGFLLKEDLIREVSLGSDKKFYESNLLEHHHHLVCKNCKTALEVENEELEGNIEKLIRKMKKQKGFSIKEHSLEFFGLCANCN